jgi:tetratricopeptide (TPR) repeat protein
VQPGFFARFPPRAGFFFIILWLAGCAAQQVLLQDNQLPRRKEIVWVPFFPQQQYQCGPAALAMAISATGAEVTPEELVPQVYLPQRKGSLQAEMLAATRRNGLIAYRLTPELSDLLTEVAAETPVIVLQNLGLNWYPVWHYAVVVGYDLDQQQIILRSGLERRLEMPFSTFQRTWQRGGSWAMMALSPERMPVGATEQNYIAAALALEQSRQLKAAQSAYQTALLRWPQNLTALIGLGNTHYMMGNLDQAEQAFREATLIHPESGVAYNNLAQTLADQGKRSEALVAAQHAVELGGPHLALFLQTLRGIQAQPESH